jgi:hypothetical protein
MDPQEAAAAAADRANDAQRRTREIADRLTRLASGRRSDAADVHAAYENAELARSRAEESFQRAMAGHERAAESHERAAQAHEEALRRGIGNAEQHRSSANRHRQSAQADREEALLDRERAAREHAEHQSAIDARGAGAVDEPDEAGNTGNPR